VIADALVYGSFWVLSVLTAYYVGKAVGCEQARRWIVRTRR